MCPGAFSGSLARTNGSPSMGTGTLPVTKLDHRLFLNWNRCWSIREIRLLTVSRIKALNIASVRVQDGAWWTLRWLSLKKKEWERAKWHVSTQSELSLLCSCARTGSEHQSNTKHICRFEEWRDQLTFIHATWAERNWCANLKNILT